MRCSQEENQRQAKRKEAREKYLKIEGQSTQKKY
jgi:hypothetical protein